MPAVSFDPRWAWHLLQRWITYRLRFACGDLFLGTYRHGREAAVVSEILAQIAERLSHKGSECHRLAPGSGGVESAPLLI